MRIAEQMLAVMVTVGISPSMPQMALSLPYLQKIVTSLPMLLEVLEVISPSMPLASMD